MFLFVFKSEIAFTLFLAPITIWSVMLLSFEFNCLLLVCCMNSQMVDYRHQRITRTVLKATCRPCINSFCTYDLGCECIFKATNAESSQFTNYPWEKHSFVGCATRCGNFRQVTAIKTLFVREWWEQTSAYLHCMGGSQHFSNRERIRMIEANVYRTDSNILLRVSKGMGKKENFVSPQLV